jgi:chaperonin GroES
MHLMRTLEPLADRIVIRRTEQEEKVGGLYIPDAAKTKANEGVVIAAGPGALNEHTGKVIPMHVAVGDAVLFGKYAGSEFAIRGEELICMREGELLGILREAPATAKTGGG